MVSVYPVDQNEHRLDTRWSLHYGIVVIGNYSYDTRLGLHPGISGWIRYLDCPMVTEDSLNTSAIIQGLEAGAAAEPGAYKSCGQLAWMRPVIPEAIKFRQETSAKS